MRKYTFFWGETSIFFIFLQFCWRKGGLFEEAIKERRELVEGLEEGYF